MTNNSARKNIRVFLAILLALPYWAFALVTAGTYGVVAGFLFKYLGGIEDWLYEIRKDYRQWKYYPKLWKQNWISLKLSLESGEQDKYSLRKRRNKKELLNDYPEAPFPFWTISIWVLVGLIGSFFKAFMGVYEGPLIVLTDFNYFWRKHVLGQTPNSRFDSLLKVAQKYDFDDNPDDKNHYMFEFYTTMLTEGLRRPKA